MATEIVYAVRRQDGAVKIGTTAQWTERLRTLKWEHGPLEVLRRIVGGRELEKQLHAACMNVRIGGEWFRDGQVVRGAIALAAKANGDATDPCYKEAMPRGRKRRFAQKAVSLTIPKSWVPMLDEVVSDLTTPGRVVYRTDAARCAIYLGLQQMAAKYGLQPLSDDMTKKGR